MTKRLHVLRDVHQTAGVIVSDVASVNAAHRHELMSMAEASGLIQPITLVSTSPIQSPLSLATLGLEAMRVLR